MLEKLIAHSGSTEYVTGKGRYATRVGGVLWHKMAPIDTPQKNPSVRTDRDAVPMLAPPLAENRYQIVTFRPFGGRGAT
jgi:hypothetical protein